MSTSGTQEQRVDAYEAPAATTPARDACLNCGAALADAYCGSCGQPRPNTDLTLRELLRETTQELTQLDGKVPRTLHALLRLPGLLTEDFLAGRRARWLPPLRLYLICSLAYFLAGPLVESITNRSAREVAKITISNADGSRRLSDADRRRVAESPFGRIFGTERLERAALDSKRLNRAIATAYPKAMFVLLPLFALLTSVAWRRALPRYPAHLYLSLHLHAAWFAALALATLATAFTFTPAQLAIPVVLSLAYVVWHSLVAFRRVFHESWTRTLLKSAAVGAVYACFLGATSLLMLGLALMTM